MNIELVKYHLLDVCHKLLALKEFEISHGFSKIFGFVIKAEGRESIVYKLLSDLIRLHLEEPTEYHIYWDKGSSVSSLKRTLRSSQWAKFIDHKVEAKRGLAERINTTFFKGVEIAKAFNSLQAQYFISEDDFASVIDDFLMLSDFNDFGIHKIFFEEVERVLAEEKGGEQTYPMQFNKLSQVFELDEVQKRILFIYSMHECIEEFSSFVSYSNLDIKDRKTAPLVLSKILRIPQSKIKKELRSNSKLSQSMLLDIDDRDIDLTDHIWEFLQHDDEPADVFSFFFEPAKIQDALDISHHRLREGDLDAFKHLIECEQGSNFLLYGEPGTGKTEFTKSLGKELGINIYRIKAHSSDFRDSLEEKRSALMAAKNILPKNSLLIIDEAEEILDTLSSPLAKDESDHKAWLNTYMEEHGVNIIWIINDLRMHKSTKRRFDFAIYFNSFTSAQRLEALRNIQVKSDSDLFTHEDLEMISKKYTLDPGPLSLAFTKVGAISEVNVDKKQLTLKLLDSQMKLLKGKGVSEKPVETFYNPEFINTSVQEKEVFSSIKKFYEGNVGIRNLCVLFQGAPGTGKTEYAKYISEALGKSLKVKRASDILSSFWGATEKNIAEMFKEAEEEGEILFIDECDSLFKDRSLSEYSWIVSETNELLTQMERFSGVLICATNFIEKLDHAAMRRFHLKVNFHDLKRSSFVDVFNAFFATLTGELTLKEKQELENVKSLNPGDFKAVYNAVVLKERVTKEEIIKRLKDESSYRCRKSSISLM